MDIEVLNTKLVSQMIDEHGWKIRWVLERIGEKNSTGYALLRDGRFPKDQDRKSRALANLARLFSVKPKDLIITLVEAKETA